MALPDEWGPPQEFEIPAGGSPPGGGTGGGGSFAPPPSILTSGAARGYQGLPEGTFGGNPWMRRRLGNWGTRMPQRQASPYASAPMSGMPLGQFPTSPSGAMQLAGGLAPLNFGPVQGWANAAQSGTLNGGGQGGGTSFNWGVLNQAIADAQKAGLFGMEPPPGLMAALRAQGIRDMGARDSARTLGIQGDASIDPSSFGFLRAQGQLQSGLENQRGMQQADFQMRQQQYQFLQDLFRQAIGGQQQLQNIQNAPRGFDWGGLAGGLGGIVGGLLGGGGSGSQSGGSAGSSLGPGRGSYPAPLPFGFY